MISKDINAANPQGKGSLSLLDDLNSFKQYRAAAKDIPEWLADYFTSLFVLNASFGFKPVMNKPYYLYYDDNQWKLSLIEPDKWNNCPYVYFAKCILHEDRSWSLTPVDNWNDNQDLVTQVNLMKRDFFESLNSNKPIVESLPYFAEHLPYYRRLAAFGLANSLKQSLQLTLGHDESQEISARNILQQTKNSGSLKIEFQIDR